VSAEYRLRFEEAPGPDSTVVRKSVARGIKEKFFGYVAGAAPALGADGRYQVAEKNVSFGSEIAEDEIDLDGRTLGLGGVYTMPPPCFLIAVCPDFAKSSELAGSLPARMTGLTGLPVIDVARAASRQRPGRVKRGFCPPRPIEQKPL
jgi:hypothetical protein